MAKDKRGGDHLTRSFGKSTRASKNESLVSGRLLGDSDKGVRSGLIDGPISDLSKSVTSITLYNGYTLLFSCSGIAMEQGRGLTRFLTSASLARALYGTNKDHDHLKIKVRHEDNEVYMGVMAEFDLDRNFAVVNVHASLEVQVGFQHALEFLPHGERLVVLGRGVSGKILSRNVEFDGDLRVSEDEDLDSKFSEAWEGGPLVSVEGKVVGMNLFLTTRRAFFLPWGTVLKHREHYLTSGPSRNLKVYRFGARPIGEMFNSHLEDEHTGTRRDCLTLCTWRIFQPGAVNSSILLGLPGYTIPHVRRLLATHMVKVSGGNLVKKASMINRNVVGLASFNGENRCFACTGFFIEWNESTIILTSASLVRNSGDGNKIDEALTIEVLLNGQRREGKLEHCSLHYNIALVSIKEYPALPPLKTRFREDKSCKVAAIGRCFETGMLMATSGDVVSWTCALDCIFHATSTCKITKAGIGGPLVTLDGDVIGMNFYDKRIGTPFMFFAEINKVLASFVTESNGNDLSGASFWTMARDDRKKLNSWPVPKPCWCNSNFVDKSDDNEVLDRTRYRYDKGKKVVLF